MEHLAEILFGLAGLFLVHWIIRQGSRKAGKSVGKFVGAALRGPLRSTLTRYYRRKVIRQMQEERRRQGLPPLENTDVL